MNRVFYSRQRGVVLIIALVLLLVISLVAVAASQMVVTSGASTVGFVDRSTAFQDAEALLNYVEKNLLSLKDDTTWTNTPAGIVKNRDLVGVPQYKVSTATSSYIITVRSHDPAVPANQGRAYVELESKILKP